VVCFKYIIVNILHKGAAAADDDDDNNNNNNNNNNNKRKPCRQTHVLAEIGHCQLVHIKE
jgi:hypothetical protein